MSHRRPDVVITAGGGVLDRALLPELGARPVVVAADSGVLLADSLGLDVAHAVGDFDSIGEDRVALLEREAETVRRHPVDKDETDLELALARAMELGAGQVLVLAGSRGRLDHTIANSLLLGADRWAELTIDAVFGDAVAHIVRRERTIEGSSGELVSLLALGGRAQGVRTVGLRFGLQGETLEPGSSRGLSNEFVGQDATVTLDAGVLLALRPGSSEADPPRR